MGTYTDDAETLFYQHVINKLELGVSLIPLTWFKFRDRVHGLHIFYAACFVQVVSFRLHYLNPTERIPGTHWTGN
jgi:hypothetical protein